MATSRDPRELRLHFDGPTTGGHMLPAEVLVNSIRQLQRIVHLLAKEHRGQPAGKRLKVPTDIKQRFGLVCKLPVAGGYGLPITIGTPKQVASDDEVFAVAERFQVVSRSLADDGGAFERLVADAQYRRWLVDAYKAAQPAAHLGLQLTIEDGQGKAILRPSHLQEESRAVDAATSGATERGYVVGKLMRMGFAKQSVALEHRGRTLTATYAPESEDALLRHPRGLIQVRGDVCYDAAGEPVSIADIDEVAEVDESPMEVEEVVYDNVRYVANAPLRFDVAFDREGALYDLEGPFGVLLSADSREDLADALESELRLLLEDYAEADPAQMSSDAKDLREKLRGWFGLR